LIVEKATKKHLCLKKKAFPDDKITIIKFAGNHNTIFTLAKVQYSLFNDFFNILIFLFEILDVIPQLSMSKVDKCVLKLREG